MKKEALTENPVLLRKKVFSIHEAENVLARPRKELYAILFRLVKKGKLTRIKRGLFCILPPGVKDSRKGYPQNWFLIAKALTEGKPHFISHYSAMQIHGMTSQSIQTIFVSTIDQLRPPKHLRIPVRFITISKKQFWGLEEKWITSEEKVLTSDRERTVIDILDRPDLSGGLTEITRALWLVKKDLDSSKLLDYAKRFDSFAVAKRLGFLMETLGIKAPKVIEEIYRFVRSSTSYAFLDPTLKKAGPYLDQWRLRINCDIAEIRKNLMT